MTKPKNIIKVRDNLGNQVDVITGLKPGDMLTAIRTTFTWDDIGMSGGVFRTEQFIENQQYRVVKPAWGGAWYVQDETGCLTFATPEDFAVPV